ncbi:MAG: 2'-5' RNA ligase family protein [Anaerolineae bacterium]
MQVVFAILADHAIQNRVRKMAVELFTRYGAPLNASLLRPHISLKQGFHVPEMEPIEAYFDRFAASIRPFKVEFDHFYYTEWNGNGILGLAARERGRLRQLHERLNAELGEIFGDVSAPHDGEAYRFHLTVEMGPVAERNPYRAYFDQLEPKEVTLAFVAREITLFIDPDDGDPGPFIDYKTAFLGKAASG